MSDELDTSYVEELVARGPQSALERRLIIEYLRDKGYQLQDLKGLPIREAKQLMSEACRYASIKLAEVEARAQFREEIQGPSASIM